MQRITDSSVFFILLSVLPPLGGCIKVNIFVDVSDLSLVFVKLLLKCLLVSLINVVYEFAEDLLPHFAVIHCESLAISVFLLAMF